MNRLVANILIAIAIIILIRSVVDFNSNGQVVTNPTTTAEPATTPSPAATSTTVPLDDTAANRTTTSRPSRPTTREADRSVPALW